MITCTRRLTFCAGHRVMGHENKCAHLHGHNYVAHIMVGAFGLDTIGRIVDFSVIKERVGHWLDANWDHAFIFNTDDIVVAEFLIANGFKSYGMACNPTAENMATYLARVADNMFALDGGGLRVLRVDIEETENCRAAYVVPHQ